MKRILCFGDSNTYGYIPDGSGRYGENIRWTSLLQKQLSSEAIVIEEGLCGRTTVFQDALRCGRCGVDLLPVILESHSPLDLVIVMLGTNDCKSVYGASAEVIGKGMEQLIEQIKCSAPKAEILVISPIQLGTEVWKSEYDPEFSKKSVEISKKLPAVYTKLAATHGWMFLAASDYANPSSTDNEHLDAKGHMALAKAIYSVIVNDYSE